MPFRQRRNGPPTSRSRRPVGCLRYKHPATCWRLVYTDYIHRRVVLPGMPFVRVAVHIILITCVDIMHHSGRCCCRCEETTRRDEASPWPPSPCRRIGFTGRRSGCCDECSRGGSYHAGHIRSAAWYPDGQHAGHSTGATHVHTTAPGEYTGIRMHYHLGVCTTASRSTITLHVHISACIVMCIPPLIASHVYASRAIRPRWWMRMRTGRL